MVDLLSVAIILWLHLSLVFALFGLFLWAFSDDDDEKRFGSRIFFVSPRVAYRFRGVASG